MNSIFDKIINKEISADIIYETDNILAFKDINPIAPVHILIIPKYNIPTMNDISNEDSEVMSELLLSAKIIAKEIGVADSGYRLVINCNEDGGQTVSHLHLHLIAGRKFNWPPG